MNPVLLARVNRLGMYLHKVITITSGARGVAGHANTGAPGSHHVPANNPSGVGEAVDAYIGKKPLASAVKEKTLARFGLYSGNRPGFYKGKPDAEHIETLERRGHAYSGPGPSADLGAATTAPPEQASQATPADVAATVPTIPDQGQPAGAPPQPETSTPGIFAPGSTDASDYSPRRIAETWQLLASQPLASPETRSYAERAALMAGNA